jgi:predicted nucleic acid-binding protein
MSVEFFIDTNVFIYHLDQQLEGLTIIDPFR